MDGVEDLKELFNRIEKALINKKWVN
jgi:hypothetical protein